MSAASWLVLPLDSERLRDALWNGRLEHEGRMRRVIPRELIVEGDRRKVLLQLAEITPARRPAIVRWWTALRGDRAALTLSSAMLVLLFGMGQGWELRPFEAILAVAGAVLLHLAVNAFAEIQDTLRLMDLRRWYGPDRELSAILEGWISPRKLWVVGSMLLLVAVGCGGPLLWKYSDALMPMAAMAALAAWGYAQPPLALKYRGWGELVLFLASGPALALGLSWCFFGHWNVSIVSLGACLGFWNVALHHVGNLLDADQDREHGVTTFVTRLGFLRARWLVPLFHFLAWLSFLPATVSMGLSPLLVFSLTLLLVPQGMLASRLLRASGCASVWMVRVRDRARVVQWFSHAGAMAMTAACLYVLGGLI
jgi:1,4-dihydroxy-2-naphthoate octaprenyltransferase